MGLKGIKRQKRALKTRSKIALTENNRLTVFRSNSHIYAQIMTYQGSEVLVSASTNESSLKSDKNGNIEAASRVGKAIAERALEKGIEKGMFKIAKDMIAKNYPLSDISSLTAISLDELQKLKSSS